MSGELADIEYGKMEQEMTDMRRRVEQQHMDLTDAKRRIDELSRQNILLTETVHNLSDLLKPQKPVIYNTDNYIS